MKAALDQRGLTTHINYRQLAIQIAKEIPAEHYSGRWSLKRVVYVTAPPIQSHNPERYERWRKFEAMIRRQERVELKLGRLEGGPGRVYEKGVDILVAIELLAGAFKNQYDMAIILSGDGDFADVARVVREAGRLIFNAFFDSQKSYELAKAANAFVRLDAIDWQRLRLAPPPGGTWGRRF
ncbi:MAG: NYN domain-containing protein [Gemmatimonadetes bacterium]|nr:NYN domain-containing protein [Gemmatimonadota bacterium]MBI2402074.1 NYN domain-containing protein [Gemmatimonadota bacterium]MBI2536332.1 NYN domain-containing protein [Gemmatimonadota bacterium]